MKYAQIRPYDTANGEGIRVSLFVTGCHFHCKGCFNEEYQNFNYGEDFTWKTRTQIIEYLKKPEIKGLTILGGEPLDQKYATLSFHLSKIRPYLRPDQDIWIYSGHTFENIVINKAWVFEDFCRYETLKHCEVLVDGVFIEAKKDLTLKFRGSSNQRIIDIQKSIKQGKPIELRKYYG